MVELGSVSQHFNGGQSDVSVTLCSFGVVLCMVVVVLGIKFRWFKQRLNFEPIPTGSSGSADNGQVVLTRSSRSSQEQFCEPVMSQGIFRKKLDEDIILERPKTLPPIRVRKASKGPPSFRPPKRSEAPSSIAEQPVVIPPPPPPLPSASLSSSSGSPQLFVKVKTPPTEGKKVNFSTDTPIIANGNVTIEYEQLKTEEEQSNRPYTERRPTGYVRPSEEIAQELMKQEVDKPKAQPRSIIHEKSEKAEKNKETFKKKAIKTPVTPPKADDEDNETWQMGQRRLTGFFPPSDEDRENMEEFVVQNLDRKTPTKVMFLLDDDEDDEDDKDDADDKEDEKTKSPPPPPLPVSPPILFSTQVSKDDDRISADSWSAIQRHRNLAKEISEQHEAMQKRRRENAEAAGPVPVFRNPSTDQQQQPKPRTMRDMKRNNARNDHLLDAEKGGTEV